MNLNSEKDDTLNVSSEFQQNLSILRHVSFFSKLPMEKLKLFAYLCTQKVYRPGDYLFLQGEDDGQAFYFLSGHAQLIYTHQEEETVIRTYGKDAFLGGFAILGKNNRIFSLRASDQMTCMVLEREKFKRVLERFPELLLPMLQGNLESIYAWEKQFLSLHSLNCRTCCKYLGVSVL